MVGRLPTRLETISANFRSQRFLRENASDFMTRFVKSQMYADSTSQIYPAWFPGQFLTSFDQSWIVCHFETAFFEWVLLYCLDFAKCLLSRTRIVQNCKEILQIGIHTYFRISLYWLKPGGIFHQVNIELSRHCPMFPGQRRMQIDSCPGRIEITLTSGSAPQIGIHTYFRISLESLNPGGIFYQVNIELARHCPEFLRAFIKNKSVFENKAFGNIRRCWTP